MIKRLLMSGVMIVTLSVRVFAADCTELPSEAQISSALIAAAAASGTVGGLFNGTRMWGAVVNRDGEHCGVAASTSDPTQVWSGSQALAKTKAYTGNAYSLDILALSTAMLYTFTQPGHSLWSLGHSNGFDPAALAPPTGGSGSGWTGGSGAAGFGSGGGCRTGNGLSM